MRNKIIKFLAGLGFIPYLCKRLSYNESEDGFYTSPAA